jgi:hypothetical protein
MKNFCDRIDSYDGSAEQFCKLFREGCELLNLDDGELARVFSCNRKTSQRWKDEKMAPASLYRFLALKKLQQLASQK